MQGSERKPIAGEVFLRALAEHGVDFFFANPGTDFPPIVEGFSRGRGSNAKLPQPVLVPHENLAVAMAHGAYTQTGRPQAVMVHVNVGTGNTINNLINLARDRVPLILAAGRTPITEKGSFGSRSRQIHWGQEMFDQAGMVREIVKWDYELRVPGQVADVVARAHEVAMTCPRGPVYLVLPREPLSASLDEMPAIVPRPVPGAAHPDPAAVEQLAEWITKAERPLVITAGPGTDESAVAALAKVAERAAIPVVSHNARSVALPSSHPMNAGYDSGPLVADADLIIVIESDAPWYPGMQQPAAGCRVAHIGEDPTFARYPMRSFPSDLSIASPAAIVLKALDAALAKKKLDTDARRAKLIERHNARRTKAEKEAGASALNTATFSAAVGDAVGDDAIIFNEYPLSLDHCAREKPGTFYGLSAAGGLGWGLGAAMGAKLAAPEKFVVATVGDGAYMFANPTVCHWVADKFAIPVLTIIFNNSRYGAVRRATLSMFKDGAAGGDDGQFLADLSPSPPFEEFMRSQGGHGERVETHAELAPALARARDAVQGWPPSRRQRSHSQLTGADSLMRIDAYTHFFPPKYFQRLTDSKVPDIGKRVREVPSIHDVDVRRKVIDSFPDYKQIICVALPPIGTWTPADKTEEVARIANDGLKELCEKYPDQFAGFVAEVPLTAPDAGARESERAIKELGACGVQIVTNVNGKALDQPEFVPFFEKMNALKMPIWVHPTRTAKTPDYATEDKSLYEIWWTFGWSYDTAAFMARMVFSKTLDRFPDLKIIVHHFGGIVPMLEGRIGPGWDQIGARTSDADYQALMKSLKKRPLNYFKEDFYADTAVFTSDAATELGMKFYPLEKIVFASDCPFDPEKGTMYIRETLRIIDALDLTKEQRDQVYYGNLERITGKKFVK